MQSIFYGRGISPRSRGGKGTYFLGVCGRFGPCGCWGCLGAGGFFLVGFNGCFIDDSLLMNGALVMPLIFIVITIGN